MSDSTVPISSITRGPDLHWFGYYDKREVDSTGRYCLAMAVDFDHRPPTPADAIRLGLIDLAEQNRWTDLAASTAWCWQQGCMLQWLPGSDELVIYNDREGDGYVCRIRNVRSGEARTLGGPIYAVSPDGRWAVTPDFRRIGDCRPGYGYVGPADPHAAEGAPAEAGIWRMDLATGRRELIVSLAEVAAMPGLHREAPEAHHWFNHLLVSPEGRRFIFLHRWRVPNDRRLRTRMLTVAADGSDLRVVNGSGGVSHFIWRDERHILAWAYDPSHRMAFYLHEDAPDGRIEPVGAGVMTCDGHCSYLPGNEWIINDTYPDAEKRRELYLYHVPTGRRETLGRFYSPPVADEQWRVDLHPRVCPDGRHVIIDSAHEGARQMYMLDISGVAG